MTLLDNPKAHTKDSLTTVGVLATEINEAEPLLMSQFYMTEQARKMEPKEVLALLSACILDGKKKDEEPSVSDLDVPDSVKQALYTLSDIWNDICSKEKKHGSRQSDWALGTFWIGPMWRWMEGESVATICTEYGVYEGNLIRSVLKLQNMLDEWKSMATFCEHTEVLDKFNNAQELILREAVIQDSLYLHL